MRLPLLAVLSAVVLSACQDPAGVGLGLLDETGADPSIVDVPPASVSPSTGGTAASGFAASANNTRPQSRVLVGDVADPLFGDVTAVGYVDATQPASAALPEGFATATVTAVRLDLRRTYAYGDTTTALPIELRQVQGTWTPIEVSPDTLFTTGRLLTTATIAPTDSVVSFELPADWVAENSAALRGTAFDTAFEGFELRAGDVGAGPGAVYGFDVTSATGGLYVATTTDTVRFPLNEVFSSLQRGSPSLPPTVAPVRAGTGDGLAVQFDLSSVGTTPLARADLRFQVDPSYARSGPFVRPLATSAVLTGVPAGGDADDRIQLAQVMIDASGKARVVDAGLLTAALQEVLLGQREYQRYELVLPVSPASLNVLPILLDPATGEPLRLVLTVVGSPG